MSSVMERARRLRLPLGFLLGGSYLLFARPTSLGSLLTGGLVALIGVMVRGWAAGHIMKNDRLATTGPYAHTRNPLYFGSFLIAAGFAIAAHWSLLLLVIAFFVLIYWPTIEKERLGMRKRFPDEYAQWEQNVPLFVPRPVPWRAEAAAEANPFSFQLYMRHGEWRAALVFALAMAWLLLRYRLGI